MWFNSMIREGPYPGLKVSDGGGDAPSPRGAKLGAAWLSSARAVRCWLKCHNERNPRPQLPSGRAGHSGGTAAARCEEGGDDVKSARPLRPGPHTCYNGAHRGSPGREAEPIPKARPSSDRGLQPDPAKLDSLVIAHQPWRGEYVRNKVAVPEGAAGTPPFWRAPAARGPGRQDGQVEARRHSHRGDDERSRPERTLTC